MKTALQDDEGSLLQITGPLHPFAKCWRVFQKIHASVQLIALTTDLPGTAAPEHGASHHSVTCILANQDPFRISQGDWSLGGLLARTLDDTRRHPSHLAISWCSCLSLQIRWNSGSSCIAFLKGVTMLQGQRSYLRWTYQSPNNAATASSLRNGNTQPTQRLGCITGVLFMSFSSAIPLWSSKEQWDCERVSRKSQQHRNPSLTKGKQMSCCRIQVAPGGSRSFSKPWQWV